MFAFKQKTAYVMRISDWSSDVCSSDLLENLKELVTALEEYETLGGFLEHISLVMENADDPNEAKVSLMTLHAAKGLEFDVVFLPGWAEGDRKSVVSGTSVSVRVDHGGRRLIKIKITI